MPSGGPPGACACRRSYGCTARSAESTGRETGYGERTPRRPVPGRRGLARRFATGPAIFPRRRLRWTLSRAEQRMKVRGGPSGHFGRVGCMNFRQRRDDARDVGRLVALAAVWHGREERTVGFDKDPFERDVP